MNRYNLDSEYFKRQLGKLVLEADNHTPQEMSLALSRLKTVADNQVEVNALNAIEPLMQTHSYD